MTGERGPGHVAPGGAHDANPGAASGATPSVAPDLAPEPAAPDLASSAAFEAKVLRGFFRDGRLVSIPAQDRKKRVVLRHLRDLCFPDDRAYPEKEVNQRLALLHPDVAALRRYLVDFQLMTRASGEYRRA